MNYVIRKLDLAIKWFNYQMSRFLVWYYDLLLGEDKGIWQGRYEYHQGYIAAWEGGEM